MLKRAFWEELLRLYDEFIRIGKTDTHTLELLEKADLLIEGTKIGKEILDAFPHLDFKAVDALVKQGIRKRIVEELHRSTD